MKNKTILKLESKIDKTKFYIGNLLLIVFLIYFLTVLKQNYVLISILIAIICFIISISSYKQIEIYPNRIVIIYKRLFLINTSTKTFYFDDIGSIQTKLRIGGSEGVLIQIIGFFRLSFNLIASNYFTIVLKNKNRKSFSTEIVREDLIKLFRLVEKLSDNKIEVTGLDKEIPLL